MNGNSPHILNTSSNLLGFCFLVITSLKIGNRTDQSVIDEILVIGALIFMSSTIFSFLSIKTKSETKTVFWENLAVYCFLAGLFILLIVILLIALDLL
ncbi:hypothetical protein [Desertivirga arenae]|uniref:hypothetical protein n=1 Tax=Desertivirga arenae TaxID=2810309 RepID=UPI001A958441|nr:hypothetical protein [Pedobacter sp. SYSU D00823]